MTRQPKRQWQHGNLRETCPERLLLMTIFGDDTQRQRVESELDRRALTGRPYRAATRKSAVSARAA